MTSATGPALDPITFAVVKSALEAVVDDMAYTIMRTARSEIVRDVLDYSATLCNAQGELIAQARTVALHLGAVPDAIARVLAEYGDDLAPGDVVVLNDPYSGGMHLPDLFMFRPIFLKAELQGFAVVIIHHSDMGGRVPGSNASDSTEIFQEGLRIPPLKLFERDVPNRTLHRLIEQNVRLPATVLGDLAAQAAACRMGERGYLRLFERYGAPAVQRYQAALIDYAERLTRAAIARWPDGTWRFEDHIDDDGFSEAPIPIRVAITVAGERLSVDFAGSAPQVRGAINSTLSFVKSATYLSVRCVLDRAVPNNSGVFRCIEVSAPEGSILNAVPPAPVAARALTGYRVVDAVLGCLAQIVPERIPAAGEGGNTVVCIGGYDAARRPFVMVDMINGAWGGRPDKDGVEAITNPSQNMSNTPVEVLEARLPVRIEEYGLAPDSCGAGRFRGGLGLLRSYRLLAEEAVLQLRSDRRRFRPYGLAGGAPAAASENTLLGEDGAPRSLPGKVTMTIRAGDLVRHVQPGGGGHGDPLERALELIKRDLADGKISRDYAERWHGVIVHPATLAIDRAASLRRRSELRRARPAGGAATWGDRLQGHRKTTPGDRPMRVSAQFRRPLLMLGALALALAPLGQAALAQEQKTIRISTPSVPEEWNALMLDIFKVWLEKSAPEQFDVEIHLNATLFAQGTEIAAMQRGNLEVGLISAQDISRQLPEWSIFTAGYLLRDVPHQKAVFYGPIGEELFEKVADEMDIEILAVSYLGTRQLNLRERLEVETPEDLAGVNLRMPGSDTWQFLGRALGANPTPMAFNEVYLGLQTGTVDGQDNPLPTVRAAKFYEVTEQIVLTSHLVDSLFFAIAKPFYDGLTPEQQIRVRNAARAATAFNDQNVLLEEQENVAFLEEQGLVVTTPDVDAFRERVQQMYLESEFSKDWPDGLLDRINATQAPTQEQ